MGDGGGGGGGLVDSVEVAVVARVRETAEDEGGGGKDGGKCGGLGGGVCGGLTGGGGEGGGERTKQEPSSLFARLS